jgi:hypothetical protein
MINQPAPPWGRLWVAARAGHVRGLRRVATRVSPARALLGSILLRRASARRGGHRRDRRAVVAARRNVWAQTVAIS